MFNIYVKTLGKENKKVGKRKECQKIGKRCTSEQLSCILQCCDLRDALFRTHFYLVVSRTDPDCTLAAGLLPPQKGSMGKGFHR